MIKKVYFVLSTFGGYSYKISIMNNNHLKFYTGQENFFFDQPDLDIKIDNQQLKDFTKTLHEINVWQWKPTYDNPLVLDGTLWELEILTNHKKVQSQGMNAYPGSDNNNYSNDFLLLISAFEKLLGNIKMNI